MLHASSEREQVLALLHTSQAGRRPLLVKLRSGRQFCDGVCEVVRECGDDFVVFHANNCMRVDDIRWAEAAGTSGDDGA